MEPKYQTSNERTVQLNILYYVLSLSKRRSSLYEAIREMLIDVQSTGVPLKVPSYHGEHYKLLSKLERFGEFLHETDRHFARHFSQDPLRMVLIGERKLLSIFKSTTAHPHALLGETEANYSAVSSSDLHRLVWSVVLQVLAGGNDRTRDDLHAAAAESKMIVLGFDAASRVVQSVDVSTRIVGDTYHVESSDRETDGALVLSPHVDVSNVIDDAVDLIVERVHTKGRNVVLLESDTKTRFQKIALIVREAHPVGTGPVQYNPLTDCPGYEYRMTEFAHHVGKPIPPPSD